MNISPPPARRANLLTIAATAALTLAATATGCADASSGGQPETMPVDQARVVYLDAVCPANGAFEQVERLTGDWEGQSLPLEFSDTEVLNDSANTLEFGAAELAEPPGAWPADVQDGVNAVAAEMTTVATSYRLMADAPTRDAAWDLRYPGDNSAAGQADEVREHLGLPPDGVENNGCR